MKNIAIFDLDYTLVYANSTYDFIFYYLQSRKRVFRLSYALIVLFFDQIGILSIFGIETRVVLFKMLRGENKEDILNTSKNYISKRLLQLQNDQVVRELNRLKKLDFLILIVSGSLDFIVSEVSKYYGVKYSVGTKLCFKNNLCYGTIESDSLYKKEREIERIISKKDIISDNQKVYFYSDNKSDINLLKKYRNNSRAIAYESGEVAYWKSENIKTLTITSRPNLRGFYIPSTYYFFSRYPLKELFYVHIPFFLLTILYFDLLSLKDLFCLLVSWLGYISLYEIGYLQNDCKSIKFEGVLATGRANIGICKGITKYVHIRYFYFLLSVFLLYYFTPIHDLAMYIALNILTLFVFRLHNILKKKYRIFTYLILKPSHLIIPLSIYAIPQNIIFFPILVFFLPFEFVYYYLKNKGKTISIKSDRLKYISIPRVIILLFFYLLISQFGFTTIYVFLLGITLSTRDILSLLRNLFRK